MIVPIQVDEATGDYFIEFPPALLARLGWKENDVLVWHENDDQTYTLKRKETDEN